jgi:hypothetical protein
MAFFYLEREIFRKIVEALRPGGLLIYKTHTASKALRSGGPGSVAYRLEPGELPRLADGLRILHYREDVAGKATAELVARKET